MPDNTAIATFATWLKQSTVDSRELESHNKVWVPMGTALEITKCDRAPNKHYKIALATPIQGKTTWCVFQEHVLIPDELKPKGMMINAEDLAEIAYPTPIERVSIFVDALNAGFERHGMNTPLRVAHFLAQICHESDRFLTTEEYASGADYEWRKDLGNVNVGDGVRYKGRGLIQVTGRANYVDCAIALGIQLIEHPEQLAELPHCVDSAFWFWSKNQLNELADRDLLRQITVMINGGTNGLGDRAVYLSRAKSVLGI